MKKIKFEMGIGEFVALNMIGEAAATLVVGGFFKYLEKIHMSNDEKHYTKELLGQKNVKISGKPRLKRVSGCVEIVTYESVESGNMNRYCPVSIQYGEGDYVVEGGTIDFMDKHQLVEVDNFDSDRNFLQVYNSNSGVFTTYALMKSQKAGYTRMEYQEWNSFKKHSEKYDNRIYLPFHKTNV